MSDFVMPVLAADMESGRVVEWLVKPGDVVHRGQVVARVDTEKAELDAEVFLDGTVREILVAEGQEVAVGTPLARIETAADAGAVTTAQPAAGAPLTVPAVAAEATAAGIPTAPPAHPPVGTAVPPGLRASPLAKRLAAELHVDIAAVTGTGPGGRIMREDIERVAHAGTPGGAEVTAAAPAPPAPPRDRVASLRASIAALMSRSKREIPHYYVGTHIDLTDALAWLRDTNESRGVRERILPAALLLKATATALHDIPELNGTWTGDHFVPGPGVHIGVAIALRGGGLIAPAIHDVDTLPLGDLMARLLDVVQRTRDGGLRGSEMTEATATVSNLGDQGVETVYGVIYPPQVALIGFGTVAERPWVRDGIVGVRSIVHATLAADHRATDGHTGARFLARLDELLQHPETL